MGARCSSAPLPAWLKCKNPARFDTMPGNRCGVSAVLTLSSSSSEPGSGAPHRLARHKLEQRIFE